MGCRPSDQGEEKHHLIPDGGMIVENRINTRRAAQILGRSPDHVLTWRRRGEIEGFRLGTSDLILPRNIQWQKENTFSGARMSPEFWIAAQMT
jgi:hypothetical protein